MSSTEELACVYSALILQDGESPITAEKLQTLIKAANIEVEPFWSGLFAKAVDSINLKDLVSKVGSGVGSPVASSGTVGPAAPAAEEKKEEKKEEEEEEDDDGAGMFGLFD